MTKVAVSKWGNSTAIRLPKAVLEALDVKAGEVINLSVNGNIVTLTHNSPPKIPSLEWIVAEMKRLGPENEPETVDWGPDVGSERFYDDE
jgi:antitoxin MazE